MLTIKTVQQLEVYGKNPVNFFVRKCPSLPRFHDVSVVYRYNVVLRCDFGRYRGGGGGGGVVTVSISVWGQSRYPRPLEKHLLDVMHMSYILGHIEQYKWYLFEARFLTLQGCRGLEVFAFFICIVDLS